MTQLPTPSFRPGTLDEAIFLGVCIHNEYQLPDRLEPTDIIIDVGAHIGSFSYAALSRGAGRVIAFEAEPSNYECARKNLEPFGKRAQVIHKAVWRSDRKVESLHFAACWNAENTGGGNVIWGDSGPAIPAAAFDDVIREVTNNGKRKIRMVKLDCEGSEFPILLTSKLLGHIQSIVGEFHEFGGQYDSNIIPEHARVPGSGRYTADELVRVLHAAGFDVTYQRSRKPNEGDYTNLGAFFAHQPVTPSSIYRPNLLQRLRSRLLGAGVSSSGPGR